MLDFSSLIANRTQHFSGRGWVFEHINQWLADPKGGQFSARGRTGYWQGAIAARLTQVSEGSAKLPARETSRNPGSSPHHFCQAGLDLTLSPIPFVQALSETLANAFPRSARRSSNRVRPNRDEPRREHGKGRARRQSDRRFSVEKFRDRYRQRRYRSMFDVAVRGPLQVHAEAHPDQGAVVLIDSLDEALTFSRDRSIAHLMQLVNDFPPNVRFILTSRSNNHA